MKSRVFHYGIWTTLAHLMLLLRDMVLASTLGVNLELDAWFTIFATPYFLSSALAGAVAGVLVPWIRFETSGNKRAAAIDNMKGFFARHWRYALFLTLSVGLAEVFAANQFYGLGVARLNILICGAIIYFIILCAQGIYRACLLGYQKTVVVVGSPIISSVIAALTLLVFGSQWGVRAFVVGLILGSIFELMLMVFICFREEGKDASLPKASLDFQQTRQSLYHLFTSGLLMGATLVVDQLMTAQMFGGGVASLNYGGKVTAGLIGAFGGVISVLIFPDLADVYAKTDRPSFFQTVNKRVWQILLLSFVPMIFIFWSSEWIIRLLFLRGEFGSDDLVLVSEIQKYYVLQLPFYFAGGVLVKSMQVMGQNNRIMQIALLNLTMNIVWNYLLGQKYGVPGIAFSTSFVYLGSFLLLYVSQKRLMKT